jgi:hypothetical protein
MHAYIYIYILLFEQGTVLDGWGICPVRSGLAILGARLGTWMTGHPPSLTTMHVSMGGGGDGRMDRQMDEWTDGWTNGQTDGRMDRRMDEWTDGWTNGQTDGRMDRRMDE